METTSPLKPTRSYARYTAQERINHLDAWKRSGQSAQDYARAHGIRLGNLYRWKRKSAQCHDTERPAEHSPFIPVRLAGALHSSDYAQAANLPSMIFRSGDFECQLTGGSDIDTVVTLAKRLKQEVFDV